MYSLAVAVTQFDKAHTISCLHSMLYHFVLQINRDFSTPNMYF